MHSGPIAAISDKEVRPVHSGRMAAISDASLQNAINVQGGGERSSWKQLKYYWAPTCVDIIIVDPRAKISKKVLAFAWGSL